MYTDKTARSTWQLLLQLVRPDRPAGCSPVVEQVIEAVGQLEMQPAEIDRIARAVAEALPKATSAEGQDRRQAPVIVRVWVSGASDKSRPHLGLEAGSRDQPEHAGWGFFVVQRQEDDPQLSPGWSHDVVELYLYQEAKGARQLLPPTPEP